MPASWHTIYRKTRFEEKIGKIIPPQTLLFRARPQLFDNGASTGTAIYDNQSSIIANENFWIFKRQNFQTV